MQHVKDFIIETHPDLLTYNDLKLLDLELSTFFENENARMQESSVIKAMWRARRIDSLYIPLPREEKCVFRITYEFVK